MFCKSFGFRAFSVLALVTLLSSQVGQAEQLAATFDQEQLQGSWEGKGPPGRIRVTIEGDSIRLHAREDFWYEATFTLPTGGVPQELHATITDTAEDTTDIGEVVYAIVKVELGVLTLAVNDGSGLPPRSFATALSLYEVTRIQLPDVGR